MSEDMPNCWLVVSTVLFGELVCKIKLRINDNRIEVMIDIHCTELPKLWARKSHLERE